MKLELNQQQKDKLKKLSNFLTKSKVHASLPIVDELESINENIKLLLDKIGVKNPKETIEITLELK